MLMTIIITAFSAVIVTWALGFGVIPWLRKLKFGQTILDIGPVWHKKDKQGTPTMGGLMFAAGIVVAFVVGMILLSVNGLVSSEQSEGLASFKAISALCAAVLFGFIGFLDDFIKVKKKQNEGLTPNQKIILQILVIAGYFTARVLSGDTSTVIAFPFIGQLDLWYFYYIVMGLGILYIVNAVNLTDGKDGLAVGCTIFCVLTYGAFAYMSGHKIFADYLNINYIEGASEILIF